MRKLAAMGTLALAALSTLPIQAQDKPHATTANVQDMKFVLFPGLPTCAEGAVQTGDPSKGPSVLLTKVATGCVIPWHWHTPAEHLMIVSGTVRLEMKGGTPVTLKSGGFAMLPSHHFHQFTCEQACSLYVYADGAFDIHYVDAQGKELMPADALRAVKETPAAPPPTK